MPNKRRDVQGRGHTGDGPLLHMLRPKWLLCISFVLPFKSFDCFMTFFPPLQYNLNMYKYSVLIFSCQHHCVKSEKKIACFLFILKVKLLILATRGQRGKIHGNLYFVNLAPGKWNEQHKYCTGLYLQPKIFFHGIVLIDSQQPIFIISQTTAVSVGCGECKRDSVDSDDVNYFKMFQKYS